MAISDAASCGYDAVMRPVEAAYLAKIRRAFFSRARGRILELGVGTGNNLVAYPSGSQVVGVDESAPMLSGARSKTSVPLARMDASRLGFADASFDAVAGSLVFCSIADPLAALAEVRRVLRPGGRLLLLEHVRGAHPVLARLTDALDVPWYAMSGSCHLNRETEKIVVQAGFSVVASKRRLAGLLQTIEAVRGS
jgi:ubiquinone/menaquinone biosynthesis C-methylase UbiE